MFEAMGDTSVSDFSSKCLSWAWCIFFLWFWCLVHPVHSMAPWASVHCAVRREISPCTCRMQEQSSRHTKSITVTCEGMTNFQQVITALHGKFDKNVDIILRISHSTLDDLPQLSFQHLGLTIHQLWLNHNNLSALPESVFSGLSKTEAFGLADNALSDVPQQILKLMPRIKVLDLNGDQIVNISSTDFQGMSFIHTLSMKDNCVRLLESNSLPSAIQRLTLSSNRIPSLNGTVRRLHFLEWLWLNNNDIESLDGELPSNRPNTNLQLLAADRNKLTRPPQELRHFLALSHLYLSFNRIVSLDGALSTTKHLEEVELDHNNISTLYPNDFVELTRLEEIKLGHNKIYSLNGSLLPLKNLRILNLTHNDIVDFNLQEIRGLRKLSLLDVSHNKIRVISGKFGNSVELEPKVMELRMEFNELRCLYGGLTGFTGLQRVNLSHNYLERLTADDVLGLDDLLILDISHNHLTTLDGTSQVILNKLEELLASHNWMVSLETDFHGLPKLCWADFSHNQISYVGAELADKTQCRLYGVNSTLRIYLQGNPAMCSSVALAAINRLESRNNTKVHGINECPPVPPPTTTTHATTTTISTTPVPYSTILIPTAAIVLENTSIPHVPMKNALALESQLSEISPVVGDLKPYDSSSPPSGISADPQIQAGLSAISTTPATTAAPPPRPTTSAAVSLVNIPPEPATSPIPPPPQPTTTTKPPTTSPKMAVIEIYEIIKENSTD